MVDWSWVLASLVGKGWHRVVDATFKQQGTLYNWKRKYKDDPIVHLDIAVRGNDLYVKVESL